MKSPAPAPAPAPARVKVRILAATVIDDVPYAPNAVAEVAEEHAAELAAHGLADASPEAVAYAESLAPEA